MEKKEMINLEEFREEENIAFDILIKHKDEILNKLCDRVSEVLSAYDTGTDVPTISDIENELNSKGVDLGLSLMIIEGNAIMGCLGELIYGDVGYKDVEGIIELSRVDGIVDSIYNEIEAHREFDNDHLEGLLMDCVSGMR